MENVIEKRIADAKSLVARLEAQLTQQQSEARFEKLQKRIIKTHTAPRHIYKTLKVNPKNDKIKVQGFDKQDYDVLHSIILRMRVCKVYNNGKLLNQDDRRHYPYYSLNKSAHRHLVFLNSYSGNDNVGLTSAPRLCFITGAASDSYGKNFIENEEKAIQL